MKNQDNRYRDGPRQALTGNITGFEDGGSSQILYSFSGYPLIKKIVLPEALKAEWEHVLATDPDPLAAFDEVFERYGAGRALKQQLQDMREKKTGSCLGIYVCGGPEGEREAKLTSAAIKEHLGGGVWHDNNLNGTQQHQGLHKDVILDHALKGQMNIWDYLLLYGQNKAPNQVPIRLAANEEMLLAAARADKDVRASTDLSHIRGKLPDIDAPVDEKATWVSRHLRPGSTASKRLFTANIEDMQEFEFPIAPLTGKMPEAPETLGDYAQRLVQTARAQHDYTIPVYIQRGEFLAIDNYALVHGRGDGPPIPEDSRKFLRLMFGQEGLARGGSGSVPSQAR